MTEPGFMAATVRAEMSLGAAPPATRAAPITTSAEVQSASIAPASSRNKTDAFAKKLRQVTLGLGAACGDGDIGAHADRHLRRIGSDNPAAENHDFGRWRAFDTTEQDAAAALGALQEMGGNLRRHAAGNRGHRCKQRQLSRRISDGFVGDGRYT